MSPRTRRERGRARVAQGTRRHRAAAPAPREHAGRLAPRHEQTLTRAPRRSFEHGKSEGMDVARDTAEASPQAEGMGPAEARPSEVQAEEGANAAPTSARPRVRVEFITLRGFKSFKEKMRLGPLADSGFTCIVGSNGAGKSVIGDALAFALGSGGRGERLRDLVNLELRAEHAGETAPRERRAIAKVSVALALENGHGEHLSGHHCSRLKLIREISASGSSSYYFKSEDCKKRKVSLAEFKAELNALGIPCDCRQRFIVMQNEQAVKVRDPVQLVKYLEVVMGLEGYSAEIERVEAELAQKHGEWEDCRRAQAQLGARRAQLQPFVRVWQQFVGDWEAFKQRKRRFLARQAAGLEKALHRLAAESSAVKKQLAKQDMAVTHAHRTLHEAEQKAAEGKGRMDTAEEEQRSAERKLQDLRVQQARIKVRVEDARKHAAREEATKQRSGLRQKKRMEAAAQQLEEAEADLQVLQGRRDSAAASVRSLHEHLVQLQQERSVESTTGPDHGLLLQWVAAREAVHSAHKHLQEAQEQESEQELEAQMAARRAEKRDLEMALASLDQKRIKADEEAQNLWNVRLPQLHGHLETLKEEESALHELIAECQTLVESSSSASAATGRMGKASSLSSLDRAVCELKQAPSSQVLGRVGDLASVVSPSLEVPVNAVLSHSTNLTSTLVVESRDAAQAVVRRFEEDRLGLVTCDILSELPAGAPVLQGMGPRAAASPALPCPLLECLHFEPRLRDLFSKYCGAWVVVENRDAAVRLLKSGYGEAGGGPRGALTQVPNIVTLNGELFKKDGEIVRSGVSSKGGRRSTKCWLSAGGLQAQNQLRCAADEGQRLLQAQKDLEAAQASLKHVQDRARSAAQELALLGARLTGLQAHLHGLAQSRDAQQKAIASSGRLESQLGAAKSRVEACQRALAATQERLKTADAACNMKGGSDDALAEIVGAIVDKEARLASLETEMMRGTLLLTRLRKQKQAQESGVSTNEHGSTTKETKGAGSRGRSKKGGVMPTRGPQNTCGASPVAEMERQAEVLACQCTEAEEQKVQTVRTVASMRKAYNEVHAAAKKAQKALHKELMKRGELQRVLDELIKEASVASSRLQRLQEGLAEDGHLAVADAPLGSGSSPGSAGATTPPALPQGGQGVGEDPVRRSGTAGGDAAMRDAEHSTGPRKGSLGHAASGACTKDATGTSDDDDSSAEASGKHEADKATECALAEPLVSRVSHLRRSKRGGCHGARTSNAEEDADKPDDEGDTADTLASEEDALLDRRRGLDMGPVEEDVDCARRLSQAERAEQAAQAQWQELQVEKEGLETARFVHFKDATDKVNDAVSRIYSSLTRDGDAYLSYTPEKTVLFLEGVQYNVRPDKHRWCAFHSLSGGQQAMACLALSFGLHSLYPSPFFFFDEFDAALDVHNVERVANHIKAHPQSQHIIISHRPQMYEKASAYIGVYQHRGTSTCVTVRSQSEDRSCDIFDPMEAEP